MGRRVDHGKRGEWSERIRRRRASGLTVAEFCEWEGVSVASFYNWQKKLSGTESVKKTLELVTPGRSSRSLRKASFLPVHVMQAGTATAPGTRIEIQFTNGIRVFVPMSDPETVENIISVAGRLSSLNGGTRNQNRPLVEDATC
jgi:hypothetical protein